MNYKSESLDDLARELKEGVVTFEYAKLDGSIRRAKGTLNEEYIPEKLPDFIQFDCDAIDTLMKEKNIKIINDYAKENGLEYLCLSSSETGESQYVFTPIKEKIKLSEKTMNSLFSYYDIEKDAFRSFKKENFKGIIE